MQGTCGTQLLVHSITQNLLVQVNAVWKQMVLLLQSIARNLRMHLNAIRQCSRCPCIAGTTMEPPVLSHNNTATAALPAAGAAETATE